MRQAMDTMWVLKEATLDYLFIVGDILKDIRMPWDPPGLGPEYFVYG